MKYRKPLLSALVTGALLFAGTVLAQETPTPPPAPAAPMPAPAPDAPPAPPAPAAEGQSPNAAVYQTPQGEVTVRSVAAPAPTIGQPPSFEMLYEVTGYGRMNLDARLVHSSKLNYQEIWGGNLLHAAQ